MSPADHWKPPPAAKVYEAFSAVADERVHRREQGQAEVVSSGRDRRYLVEWVKAVNEHGGFGKWKSDRCLNPSHLPTVIHKAA